MPMGGLSTRATRVFLPEGAYVRHAVTSREEALPTPCPRCNVAPGERCVEEDGVTWRKALHVERHTAAIEAGARIRFIGGARVHYLDEQADRAA